MNRPSLKSFSGRAEPRRRRGPRRASLTCLTLLALTACAHGEPFAVVPPDTVGPFTGTLPRRLTFNPLGDITPSVIGDTVVFSRVEADRADGDRCLALLPVGGGRLYGTACARGALADSVRDAWLYPVVSPDRRRVAFVRERYLPRTGALLSRVLVVAPLDAPDSALATIPGAYPLPGDGVGNGFRRLTWADEATLRFLGGTEIAGDGAVGGFVPAGVFQVSLTDGAPSTPAVVPELGDATAFATGEDGAVYVRGALDPAAVRRVVSGSAPVEVTRFTDLDTSVLVAVADLAVAGGRALAIGTFVFPEGIERTSLMRRDLMSGPQEIVNLSFEPQRLAGVPGRDLVIVEAAGDLWLVAAR